MWNPFSKNSQGVRASSQNPKAATQLHLRIAEIRDNTLVLKNGGLRTVLKVGSLNFNLKSEAEQNAIIFSYQAFLNTLEFPIQIVIQSKKLDLDGYIEKLAEIEKKQPNLLLQNQTREYVEYIQRLIEYADIMEKEFFVVVPMDPPRSAAPGFIESFWSRMHPADTTASIMKRHQEFDGLKKNLVQRMTAVSTGLESCGLKVAEMTTKELMTLFYQIYNPITSRNEKNEDMARINIQSDADLGNI